MISTTGPKIMTVTKVSGDIERLRLECGRRRKALSGERHAGRGTCTCGSSD